jgi:hypothetical protein
MTARHPLAEARVTRYGEPPTMPDIDPDVDGAPRDRPEWWPEWWELRADASKGGE